MLQCHKLYTIFHYVAIVKHTVDDACDKMVLGQGRKMCTATLKYLGTIRIDYE